MKKGGSNVGLNYRLKIRCFLEGYERVSGIRRRGLEVGISKVC